MSYKVSKKIIVIADQIFDLDLTEEETERYIKRIHLPVRKLAHVTEYAVLAITIAVPLYVYGVRGFALMLVAGFICIAFAAFDEYHQSFVAGRGPSKKDVAIDSIGVFLGILFVRITGFIGRKTIFRSLAGKERT